MICQPQHRGLTIIELLAVVAVVVCLMAAALPVIGKVRARSGVEGSINNLVTLSVAHVLYAADWSGRQVTWVVDDLAVFGSVANYNNVHGCDRYSNPEGCHPDVRWGWGCEGYMWSYRMTSGGHHWAVNPIIWSGGAAYFGNFRFPNAKAFHDYVAGRAFDPTYYAPNDLLSLAAAELCLASPCETLGTRPCNPPIWPTYALSPAAMFHPDVMRSNAAGGWQDAWSLPHGFESPGLFQAQYPDLKTHMIEHQWLQNVEVECNTAFDPFGSVLACEPYYFNHGLASSPVALFYDGHVRLLPNTEVLAADQRILKQTGGVDGLWHRGTPFGKDGYFISVGFDGVPLSHHILTTDGILGRDTVGGSQPPPPFAAGKSWRRASRLRRAAPATYLRSEPPDLIFTTVDGDQP